MAAGSTTILWMAAGGIAIIFIGLDQAAGADPFITTIKDISALAIYFGLVNVFLAHML